MDTKLSAIHKSRRMYANILNIFVILMLVFPMTGGVSAEGEEPGLRAFPDQDRADGMFWPVGAPVELTINGVSFGSQMPDNTGHVDFPLTDYDLKRGDFLTLSSGDISVSHTARQLFVTFINLDAQIVSGTVDGGPQTVHVWLGEVQKYVETDGSGNWQADFSLDGNVLFPGACGNAEALEGPGSTIIDWCIANPHIEAFAWFDRYLLVDWPAGVPVEVTIQNPDYQAEPLVPADPASTYDFLPGVDLQPGSIITASNGMTTKVLEISPLSASAEAATGFVTGVATPGRSFHMKTDGDHFQLPIEQDITASLEDGTWSVTIDQYLPWEWLTRGEMWEGDDDGDVTYAIWNVHHAVVEVWLAQNEIRTFDWPLNTKLTFNVDRTDIATAVTQPLNWIEGASAVVNAGDLRLQPGMTVTVTDGTTPISTVVQDIKIEKIDSVNDLVYGHAPAGASLDLGSWEDSPVFRFFNADNQGQWMVDYQQPSLNGTRVDLNPGDELRLFMRDSDKDATVWGMNVPNPRFDVRANTDRVEAWEWTIGETVTLEVGGQAFTETVKEAPWDPNQSFVEFDLSGMYDIKPGDVVSLSNGLLTKTTTVTELAITNIDVNADTVSGIAAPNSHVDLWVSAPPDWHNVNRHVTADENGNWIADYTVSGSGEDEQETYDIVSGAWIDSQQPEFDPDGDKTMFGLTVPFIWADPLCECVNGWDWSVGSSVTLQVFDQDHQPLALQNPTKTYTKDGGVFFELWSEGIDLQPGYQLIMSNDVVTKELVVTKLLVREMNPVANTISGVRDPALGVYVHIDDQEPLSYDFDGDQWIATFEALPVDGYGEASQADADGDKTGMGWDGIPNFMRYDIYRFDPQNMNTQRITKLDGTGEYDPSWSPNGKKVVHDVVYWSGPQSLSITDVKTGVSTPLAGGENGGNDAAWSPSGKWIAFDRRWNGEPNIYIVSADGGAPKLVRNNAVRADWAPNSKRLVFQQPSDGSIRTVAADGGKGGETLIALSGSDPAWSPDGNWIAYELNGNLWKIQVNILGKVLGAPIQVTQLSGWSLGAPTWSLDSQSIIFNGGVDDDQDIWKVPAAGGDPVWLTGAAGSGDYGPENARNSSNIAYAGFSSNGLVSR